MLKQSRAVSSARVLRTRASSHWADCIIELITHAGGLKQAGTLVQV
jgi:hypothetical protein